MSLRTAARTHLHPAPLDNCEPAARKASRLVRSGDEILQPACERNRQQEALNLRRYSPNPRQFSCTECSSWVIHVVSARSVVSPLIPQQPTSERTSIYVAMGHKPTWR